MIERRIISAILGATLPLLSGVADADEIHNPKPLPDDLVLSLPGGVTMAFRPVSVGESTGPFSSTLFKIGDREEGGYQESPTDITVGGSVAADIGGKKLWVFYMGKYEVTESQWHAVMGGDPAGGAGSILPIRGVSWFEVHDFLKALNIHLLTNARDRLPGGESCFARLPFEAEWEFAARGGLKVSPEDFDRKHPYPPEQLREYEWFAGAGSSNNNAKKIGGKSANPLGLHDMLGNVSELTATPYSVEYYQGRTGGYVSKGGNFFTDEERLRSSTRDEFTLFLVDGADVAPRKVASVGLRVVLGTQIFSNPFARKQMEQSWESYRQRRSVPSISTPNAPNRAAQVAGRIVELTSYIDRVRSNLERGNLPEAKAVLGLADSSAKDIAADANAVETTLAQTLVEAAYLHASHLGRSLATAAIHREDFANKLLSEADREQSATNAKLSDADAEVFASRYAEDIRRMGGANRSALDAALSDLHARLSDLTGDGAASAGRERQVGALIGKHVSGFRNNPRIAMDRYREDLFAVFYVPPN